MPLNKREKEKRIQEANDVFYNTKMSVDYAYNRRVEQAKLAFAAIPSPSMTDLTLALDKAKKLYQKELDQATVELNNAINKIETEWARRHLR